MNGRDIFEIVTSNTSYISQSNSEYSNGINSHNYKAYAELLINAQLDMSNESEFGLEI